MRVLIVKTSSMGDVIHTFPSVTDALRHRPDITFDWCVEEPFAGLAALHPGIERIHKVAVRSWRKAPLSAATRAAVGKVRKDMRAPRYDLVIDAQGLLKSVFLAKLAGAPIAGFDRNSAREGLSALFYRDHYAVARGLHAISRTRLLFGAALGYQPDLSSIENGIVAPVAQTPPYGARTAFLLHGTSWESKKWPLPAWTETAKALVARGFTPVTTWSNPAEQAVAEGIADAVPETVVIPRSPLTAIAAEIGRASLVIGADTGLMHLASAFGVPTIAIFLATEPGLTGPVGPCSVALAAETPGGGVSVGRVLAVADQLLEPRV
ncbi:lipopolysaccharide heptosyltransferase I [Mesorhizobium sp. L-8-10]|uniref:lipopolysaccharide heptosyltransferase I n=1 Tax=Mesorhizobium sp. L-8-10 TaxID=2744523 RepID=UPI0019277569|nr:lipopolysaccharide heptosyltransferase I [Mesorhizobium sp. L-8-10]BCH31504.1 lipopolysaccharide heptosyltransferase I [Mesorhizobium sp. L-8-10]